MLSIPDLTGADVMFGSVKHLPRYEDIPAEFKDFHNPFARAVSTWFFKGAKREGRSLIVGEQTFTAKPGVDDRKALAAIKAILGSFEPKHEHKNAGCAYLLSEWFDRSQGEKS